jgi:hypothetical protein
MKKYLLALTAICFLLTIWANAQHEAARVDVPFPFMVNGTSFPSGSYTIRGLSGVDNFVTIENKQTGHSTFVPFRHVALAPGKTQHNTRLIFTKSANQYVLHQVRLEGDLQTHDLIHVDIVEPTIKPED